MKIIYTPNPLRTVVQLDAHEKKEFWYKIKIEEMGHLLFDAHFYLTENKYIDRAKEDVDPKYYMEEKRGEKTKLDDRVDELFKYFIADLEHNPHCGDCTCVAMSCSKCQAESLLGIDTIAGLGKHEGSKIAGTFAIGNSFEAKDERSLNDVIQILANYEPKANWEGWEAHAERWKEEGKRAYQWLIAYRDKHFGLS